MELEEYAAQDGVGLAALVRGGEVTAAEVEEAARRAIAAVEPALHATVGELYESAFDASSEGPFAGIPMLMKDVAPHLEGQIVQAGSRLTGEGVRCPADTHLGQRIRAAGFRVIGRTRAPEFAFNATTEPIVHGPTCNPWDLERERRGLERRGRRPRRGPRAADRPRHGRGRVDPDSRLAVRDRGPEGDALAHPGRPGALGGTARHGARLRAHPHGARHGRRPRCPARPGPGGQVPDPSAGAAVRGRGGRRPRAPAGALDDRGLVWRVGRRGMPGGR